VASPDANRFMQSRLNSFLHCLSPKKVEPGRRELSMRDRPRSCLLDRQCGRLSVSAAFTWFERLPFEGSSTNRRS
jgi:hypothetical protein